MEKAFAAPNIDSGVIAWHGNSPRRLWAAAARLARSRHLLPRAIHCLSVPLQAVDPATPRKTGIDKISCLLHHLADLAKTREAKQEQKRNDE